MLLKVTLTMTALLRAGLKVNVILLVACVLIARAKHVLLKFIYIQQSTLRCHNMATCTFVFAMNCKNVISKNYIFPIELRISSEDFNQ